MLAKTKHYLNSSELLLFYHTTFSSLLLYGSQIWGMAAQNIIKKIEVIQNNAIRLISQDYQDILQEILIKSQNQQNNQNTHLQSHLLDENVKVYECDTQDEEENDNYEFEVIHVNPFYHSLNLLKLKDNITLKNCLLVHDYINQKLPESFDKYFILQSELNTIHTRQSSIFNLQK